MYELPTTVVINDTIYTIRNRGDYRMVLDCFQVLNDVELSEEERIIACLLIFYEDFNEVESVLSLDGTTFQALLDNAFLFLIVVKRTHPQKLTIKLLIGKRTLN